LGGSTREVKQNVAFPRGPRGTRPTVTRLSGLRVPTLGLLFPFGSSLERPIRDLARNQIVRSPPQPQIRQVYPVNLSILMTGGKETNQDVRSSSERSGLSSNLKSGGPRIFRIVVLRSVIAGHASTGTSPLKRGRRGGRDPRIRPRCREPTALTFRRVGLFGNAARIG
jgi:hypothetical protein